MNAFVTGGSGFVGRALIARLSGAGHAVRALARSERAMEAVRKAGAEPVRGDLEDAASLRAGMEGCEVAFHSGAKVEVWGAREDFRRINVEGTGRVLEAAASARVRRVVHVSTEAVLVSGRPLAQLDETRPLPADPMGLYPWSKGRAEELVRAAAIGGLETVIVRPRAVWGAGDTSVLPKVVEAIKAGRFAWIGGGKHLTSTCHVENLVAAMLLAAERGPSGETYFVTDGAPITMREFLGGMLDAVGVAAPDKSVPLAVARALAWLVEGWWSLAARTDEPPIVRTAVQLIGREVTVRDDKARRMLGYREVVTREEGLAELRRVGLG